MSDYSDGASSCNAPDFEIDPDATLDYAFNWAAALDDDTIATSVFLLPDGLTEESSQFTDTTATVFLSGAAACARYRVTNRVTTVGGRTLDKTIVLIGREQ